MKQKKFMISIKIDPKIVDPYYKKGISDQKRY